MQLWRLGKRKRWPSSIGYRRVSITTTLNPLGGNRTFYRVLLGFLFPFVFRTHFHFRSHSKGDSIIDSFLVFVFFFLRAIDFIDALKGNSVKKTGFYTVFPSFTAFYLVSSKTCPIRLKDQYHWVKWGKNPVQTFLPSFTVFRFLARLAFCLSSQTGKKRTKKTAKIFLFFSPFYFGVWSEKKNGGKKNGGKTKWRQKNGD